MREISFQGYLSLVSLLSNKTCDFDLSKKNSIFNYIFIIIR